MNEEDKIEMLSCLDAARIHAGAEMGELCNKERHIEALVFSVIRDTLKNMVNLLNDYDSCKGEGDEAYKQGLNDAWECARKLSLSSVDDGGLDETVIEKLFGCRAYYVVRDISPSEAIAKIKEYEEKPKADEIKVGDEVVIDESIGIVTRAFPGAITCYVMRRDGSSGEEDRNDCKKTGRHFPQIAEALEKMKEDKE